MLCLATQAMLAIFTDSSHQHIWFPLPQTVTFIETSLQMSGLQTTGEVKSTWPLTGLLGLAWTGMLVFMNVL